MTGYCTQCARTVYLMKGDVPACPVCSSPLGKSEPAPIEEAS